MPEERKSVKKCKKVAKKGIEAWSQAASEQSFGPNFQ